MKKNQRSIFLFIGLILISLSQIAAHYIKMPDFILGTLMGLGIGVMLLSFIKQKRKTAS